MTTIPNDLVAAIDDDPYDIESYRVYGDQLEAAGDPRGPLVGMWLAHAQTSEQARLRLLEDRMRDYISPHEAVLLGPLRQWMTDSLHSPHWRWRCGFVHAIAIDAAHGDNAAEIVRDVLSHPAGRFVAEISSTMARTNQAMVDVLIDHAPPTLRELTLHLWEGAQLADLWERVPRLRRLWIGGEKHRLGDIELPVLVQAKLNGANMDSIVNAVWPALEDLSISTPMLPDDMFRFLDRTDLPKLRRLTLWFCKFTAALSRRLGDTVIGRQLTELDLTYSDLDDETAIAWARNPPPQRLALLRARETSLTKAGRDALAKVAERVIARQRDE